MSQRRVGGDAGIPVRATAFESDHQAGCILRRASGSIDPVEHGADRIDRRGDRLLGTANLLDRHRPQGFAFFEGMIAQDMRDLVGLAAEPDHQHASDVRMARIAGDRAGQVAIALGLRVDGAAAAVGESDDAIDVLVAGKAASPIEVVCDGL